ncbi:alpha-glucosidase [Filimonas lacunae]|uniref:Alpha-glucosidase n=1 Tax=Filimonas lacunae TaxID=477680 RepID=A0A173MHV5_9BACT|nr:glycoside hydrolase family 97 protein [Filimonas lacunae]BAV06998.1 alpha-glucosidase [Filimonas lacunae]SIS96646.1 alpha-glucosidase [Filimonas lacunae]
MIKRFIKDTCLLRVLPILMLIIFTSKAAQAQVRTNRQARQQAKAHTQAQATSGGYAKPITQVTITSPDDNTRCEISTAIQGRILYRVWYKQQLVLRWSPLGLRVNNSNIGERALIQNATRKSIHQKQYWPLGENDTLVNHYQQLTLQCQTGTQPWKLIARAYNGSIAFRYELNGNGEVQQEYTGFYFTAPYTLYQYNEESEFTPTALDTFTRTCDFPATLQGSNKYLHIGEAANTCYTKAELHKSQAKDALEVIFPRDSAVTFQDSLVTPWRTISVASTAIALHHYSQLNLLLAQNDTPTPTPNWIKPGKLIRAQLTTQSGLECIDFAVAHHFQYIMYDAGWYGAEFRTTSNPTTVIPAIDMPKVIAYGKEKGIGVILYVNYVGLRQWLDTILPLYKQWGVAGLKFGFVDGLTQQGLTWLSTAMQKVYEHGFILDIHDNYKPTGLSIRYPQLLTQEGIRGDENCPDAFHNTLLPFTRFLAGPADFTFCYPNATSSYSKQLKVSKAQQLALTVVYFSPLQAIFWYGKPKEYTNDKEIAFFTKVPTVWNESHYLKGEPGKYISVARRHGNTWFIGNAAGLNDWKDTLTLNFLQPGKNYTATAYEDDGNGSISIRTFAVKKGDILPVSIAAKGGQAIIIELPISRIQ